MTVERSRAPSMPTRYSTSSSAPVVTTDLDLVYEVSKQNAERLEAALRELGAIYRHQLGRRIEMGAAGQSRTTSYAVPNEGECVTCHQSDGTSAFIGPTVRNLNRMVTRDGNEVNQLVYLTAEGVVDDADWASAPTIPDYRDDLPLERKV